MSEVQHFGSDLAFPFTRPSESGASMFIQWKGTDLCMDFDCSCGGGGHLDGDFAYSVRCPDCGLVWQMGTQVIAQLTTDPFLTEHAKLLDNSD